jgi:hypothetical protein
MGLSRDPIYHTIYNDLKRGTRLLLDNECFASALIVLMASIDAMANLDRPEDGVQVTREDFIRWAERYLTPALPFGVTGEELYSHRCAILHTLGAESNITRAGRARRIGFIAGGNMRGGSNAELVLMNIEAFAQVFFAAINVFLVEAFNDPGRRERLERRLDQVIMPIPYEPPVEGPTAGAS